MTMPRTGLVRSILKRIPGLKSAFYLVTVLRQSRADEWRHSSSFDAIFSADPDPWKTSSSARDRDRFAVTLSRLEKQGLTHFERGVEIGCAEGFFTARIAPMCDRLEALDYSAVALSHARARVNQPNVEFRKWDMRTDEINGMSDLMVAMGVLTSLNRAADVKRISSKLIDAIDPGGWLLYSDVRQSRVFEEAWWGRLVLRGGEQIRRYLKRHPALETLQLADTESHVFALFRKRVRAA